MLKNMKYKEICPDLMPGVYAKRTDYKKVVKEAVGFAILAILAYPILVVLTLA